jgi:SWI/SNF-related matrix-associated actin-dependent regulator of chromatin subfamily A member 5
MINDDTDAIIQRGEERAVELNSKYEGLNLDHLNNFKSDVTVQQWEGQDFGTVASTISHIPRGRALNCVS